MLKHRDNDIERLRAKVERLERALKYIIDHKWVSTADDNTHYEKWINEFVDVAKKALEGGGK